jgi:hypothetical protein
MSLRNIFDFHRTTKCYILEDTTRHKYIGLFFPKIACTMCSVRLFI